MGQSRSARSPAESEDEVALRGAAFRVTVKVLKLGNRVKTALDLHHAIQEGLAYDGIELLAAVLDTDADEIARIVALPKRTLARRRASGVLSMSESERVVRLARAYARALDVLGDPAKAGRWLRASNRSLAGEAPIDLVETDVGARAVEDVLGRIEHGIVG
jgi:putative toxin-antitoxin system antitoxin component (TIGR02293 family)